MTSMPPPSFRHVLAAALLLLGLAACDRAGKPSAAAEPEAQVYTHFTERSELFVEFAPLVAGQKSTFAAHFTRLADYEPVTAGSVDVILSGGNAPTERFRVNAPRAPGIFAPTVLPRATGRRNLSLELNADGLKSRHDLGDVMVYPDAAASLKAGPAPGFQEGEIGYLKEQQWPNDFALEQVSPRELRDSVLAPATIRASGDGSAEVVAATAGILRSTGDSRRGRQRGARPDIGDAGASPGRRYRCRLPARGP